MLSSRSTHLPTDGRVGAKTPGLENATHWGTGKLALKSNATVPLPPNTQSRTHKEKDISMLSTKSVREVARPLGDRTPFPNRSNKSNTPLPDTQKLAKLLIEANRTNALFNDSPVPESARRASSGRTHVRAPRLSVNNTFVTPLNSGRHWDVSDVEIVAPQASEPLSGALESEDYDEIEYMPPKSVEIYTPPFDFSLPNYSHVGNTLLRLAHRSPMCDDAPPAEPEPAAEPVDWSMFALPELTTDDPFLQSAGPTRMASLRPRVGRSDSRMTPTARTTSHIRLPKALSATNTTVVSGSKRAQGLNVRPATATAMYPLKRGSAQKSAPGPAQGRMRAGGEVKMLEISSPEIEDDFLFDV